MQNKTFALDDNHIDDDVDTEIAKCINLENLKSFFLFAGAGSGKTRSLVKVLEAITTSTVGENLRLRGQQVGVITYTNNACDEIKRRLKNDALVYVSTIHSFVWDLIRGFNTDIKKWLKSKLEADISELRDKKPSRQGTKAEIDRINKIKDKEERLKKLDNIKKFTYNPNSNNTELESLIHSEVLQLGASFLTEKPLMQKILIKKFPILLIDESQDTNKGLMNAFLSVQTVHKDKFSLGLLGDTMQRIYGDGESDLEKKLPEDWEKPAKKMNHRSPTRIIELINKIRSDVDVQKQQERQDKKGGFVRLFIIASNKDKQIAETDVMRQMASITGDAEWNKRESVVSLILEHHMAANRMGFGEMFSKLYKVDEFQNGLSDGTLPEIRIFSEIILPILEAHKKDDKFAIANIVKNNSWQFNKRYINEHKTETKKILENSKIKIDELCNAYDNNPDITFRKILEIVFASGLFNIPNGYKPILTRTSEEREKVANVFSEEIDKAEELSVDKINCLDEFLNTKFSQIREYSAYINKQSPFFTHQGVKGLEFPRVMVIIDDSEARGFLFSYEKLFGIKQKTDTDIKNEKEGKETGIDRTRRLFYVICSRAKESLAVVAYTNNPLGLKASLSGKGWFSENEIVVIN
ncbi:MAG: AAA family ATPase [Fibromonadaceae bacterium]|jgi:DNA helicase-2/ATP-dependent DNA helicase PcrA|nr:AAA family ATPase [Fibromonadaceae bacterium]